MWEDAGLSPTPKRKVTRGGNVAEASRRRLLSPDPAESPAETLAVRPRAPQPFLRAEPEPRQPGSTQHSSQFLCAPPFSEPSTWPQGRRTTLPVMPSAPTCPPPPASFPHHRRRRCVRRFRSPDPLRALNRGCRLSEPALGGREAQLALSRACDSRVVGQPSAR